MPPLPPLGSIALALLQKRYPVARAPVDEATFAALLGKRKLAGHEPAIAFERDYGGILFPDYGEGRGWQKSNVDPWILGAAACLEADILFTGPGKRKLVPVIYTTNDNAYYLAADGVAWGEDTIGDAALQRVAPNARSMMTRILFEEHVFYCPYEKKVELAAAKGEVVAAALKLDLVEDASDPRPDHTSPRTGTVERWWSDGVTFVVERLPKRGAGTTRIAYPPAGALAKLGIEEPAPRPKPSGPTTFDSVSKEYFDVALILDIKGAVDDVYTAFFDAQKHGENASIVPSATKSSDGYIGAEISFEGGAYVGTIVEIDSSDLASRRICMQFTRGPFTKKASRVEIFFRDFSTKTMINIFQFGVKYRLCSAAQSGWFTLLEAFRRNVEGGER